MFSKICKTIFSNLLLEYVVFATSMLSGFNSMSAITMCRQFPFWKEQARTPRQMMSPTNSVFYVSMSKRQRVQMAYAIIGTLQTRGTSVVKASKITDISVLFWYACVSDSGHSKRNNLLYEALQLISHALLLNCIALIIASCKLIVSSCPCTQFSSAMRRLAPHAAPQISIYHN